MGLTMPLGGIFPPPKPPLPPLHGLCLNRLPPLPPHFLLCLALPILKGFAHVVEVELGPATRYIANIRQDHARQTPPSDAHQHLFPNIGTRRRPS